MLRCSSRILFACNSKFGEGLRNMADTTTSRFKIYTKTGDSGTSSLYNGERRSKEDVAFHALGDVDELNSVLGVARSFCTESHQSLAVQLELLQSRLLDVGSAVATPLDSSAQHKINRVSFASSNTDTLEQWIDEMDLELPPLKNFILPSGGKTASFLHLARSTCRRAERSVIPLAKAEQVDQQVLIFLNRLSDYLFTAARYAAKLEGSEEVVYKKQ